MAKIKKAKPSPHLVFADTSTLWHGNKKYVVDPRFDDFWMKYSSRFSLSLAIPEVVRGELLFQQTTAALNRFTKAQSFVEEMAEITNTNYSHRINESRIKNDITK